MSWYEFLGGILLATGGTFVIWYFFVWKPDERERKKNEAIDRLNEYQAINRKKRFEQNKLRPTDPEYWTGI